MCVASTTNNSSLKSEFLRLLKEDEEFRYAIAGLIGFGEVLKRLDRHEEELKRLREDFLVFVKEQEKRWEENNRRWEENNKRWEEAYKRFEAIENELRALREDFNRLHESVTMKMNSFERKLMALGARWGIESEEAFREGMRGIVEKILGVARTGRWIYRDEAGEVYGYPSIVEVDLAIKDDVHILVEVKSSVSKGDVAVFWRIGKLYEKVARVKPKLVIVSPYVDEKAVELATNLGIEIYTDV
ncbi:MAG: DUF3782 domain-containing protein [Ignisphaera sp.]